ncbi:MAG: outer membrane protein transport protein [Gammaproteobacteria bacterium]|nr:outer membrane protein transport protein [Gammaproteobacteria bacterium]
MSVKNKIKLVSAVAVSSLFTVSVAQATNGYFSHGFSTKEKGLAGAGVAYSQDAMAAATNPAGMAFVGERMDIGVALFSPSDRSYTVTGTPNARMNINAAIGEPVFSDNDFFLIPQVAYNWQLDSDSAVGISVYGNGGMNTEYPASATPGGAGTFGNPIMPFNAGNAGVNLEQLFINVSLAKKSSANHAVGASLIVAGQRFAAQGIDGFAGFSTDGANMSGNRHSTSMGAGFKVGYQGAITNDLHVGVSYQSRISMGEFDEYRGLFAEGGNLDIPSTATVGLAYDVGASSKLVFDVQRINYSEVDSIANPIENFFGCPALGGGTNIHPSCLGGANGPGFGWEDMTIVKLGYELEAGGNIYRFGYSTTDQPIPESQTFLNILAPGVMEEHYTFGMTMPVGKNQEFNFAAMISPSVSVKGANPFDGGQTQIELEMEQKEIQVGWAWKY